MNIRDTIRIIHLAALSPRGMAPLANGHLASLGLSELQRIILLGQLQLNPLAHHVAKGLQDPMARDFASFLTASFNHRVRMAQISAFTLLDEAAARGWEALPIKGALLLSNGIRPKKFFRDLDILVEKQSLEGVLEVVQELGGFVGDISEKNFGLTIRADIPMAQLVEQGEVFATLLAGNPPPEAVVRLLDEPSCGKYNEWQFYVKTNDGIATRIFLNFIFVDEMPRKWHDEADIFRSYTSQLLKDTRDDITEGCVKMSALVALRRMSRYFPSGCPDVFGPSGGLSQSAINAAIHFMDLHIEKAKAHELH